METIIIKQAFDNSDLVLKRDRFSGQWFRSRPLPIRIFDESRVIVIAENYEKRGFRVIRFKDREVERLKELKQKGRIVLT